MAQFPVNTHRFDPYKNFKFRVRWDGRVIAGVSRISGLARLTEAVEHRAGGEPNILRKSPGRTSCPPIVLERGITHDTEFEQWADKVWNAQAAAGAELSLRDYRKDILIELCNEAGQVVIAYRVYRCWVSEFRALPELDARTASVAIESITLENEGWERDTSVTEPLEPTLPAHGDKGR